MDSFDSLVHRFREAQEQLRERCDTLETAVTDLVAQDGRVREANVQVSVVEACSPFRRLLSVDFFEVADMPAKLNVEIPQEALDSLDQGSTSDLALEVVNRVLAHREQYAREREQAQRDYWQTMVDNGNLQYLKYLNPESVGDC